MDPSIDVKDERFNADVVVDELALRSNPKAQDFIIRELINRVGHELVTKLLTRKSVSVIALNLSSEESIYLRTRKIILSADVISFQKMQEIFEKWEPYLKAAEARDFSFPGDSLLSQRADMTMTEIAAWQIIFAFKRLVQRVDMKGLLDATQNKTPKC
jgi:hypothetical protein